MFKRLMGLVVGCITFGIVKMEESNPEFLLEKLNNDFEKQIVKIKKKMIDAKVNLKLAEKNTTSSKEKIDNLQGSIVKAIKNKDEELLVQLYVREKEYQKNYEIYKKLFDDIAIQFGKAQEDYKLFCAEMELKAIKIESCKTQSQVNKMRKDMIKAIDMDFRDKNFERIEKIVDKQGFEVESMQEFEENNVSLKIKKMNIGMEMEEAREKAKKAIEIS